MNVRIDIILNNDRISSEVNPSLPLSDFIRSENHLFGTKVVCREGDCGACTVLVGELKNGIVKYKSVTSCIFPVINANGCHVVTIEGLNGDELIPQQDAFVEEGASQCGFCTPGYIMSLTNYLINSERYEYSDAINALGGNICRCTGYESIKRAAKKLIESLNNSDRHDIEYLIEHKAVPEYFKTIPERLSEIHFAESFFDGAGKIVVGGGTDLFVQQPDNLLRKNIQFLKHTDLNFIDEDEKAVYIGAGTTFEDFKQSEIIRSYLPRLAKKLNLVASLPIRNVATIGGNIANASPIGDLTIILLALNAKLVLKSSTERMIDLSEFYLDYKKLDKQPDEIIETVFFFKPEWEFHFNFEKVSKRTYLDIASVNTAIAIEAENDLIKTCNISAGGVAPVPKCLDRASSSLLGKDISVRTIEKVLAIADEEISPIDDIRGSAEYKRILLGQLIKAHFIELFPEKINAGELV